MEYVVLNHIDVTRWSQDSCNEHNSVTSFSSSSYFTSILVNWKIGVLKFFKWSTIFVHSFILNLYKCLFRKILFINFFFIKILSSMFHKPSIVSSPTTLNKTSFARHKHMVLRALESKSSQCSYVILANLFVFLINSLCNPCCTSKSHIFNF